MTTPRLYNCLKDGPDPRDYRFQARVASPKRNVWVDLRPLCPPIFDQGRVGSCTAQAGARALGFLEIKNRAELAPKSQIAFDTVEWVPFSRLFIYAAERELDGTLDRDVGSSIRTLARALANVGACTEGLWPHDASRVLERPGPECYAEASKHRITSYYRLDDANILRSVKSCLDDGYPVVFNMAVYPSFESGYVARTGCANLPNSREEQVGRHAVTIVGYEDDQGHFIVDNSWGNEWGDEGSFYLPYEYIARAELACDFWTFRL